MSGEDRRGGAKGSQRNGASASEVAEAKKDAEAEVKECGLVLEERNKINVWHLRGFLRPWYTEWTRRTTYLKAELANYFRNALVGCILVLLYFCLVL